MERHYGISRILRPNMGKARATISLDEHEAKVNELLKDGWDLHIEWQPTPDDYYSAGMFIIDATKGAAKTQADDFVCFACLTDLEKAALKDFAGPVYLTGEVPDCTRCGKTEEEQDAH